MKEYYCDNCGKMIVCVVQQEFANHRKNCMRNTVCKVYKLKCKKCNKEYELSITPYQFKKGNYRKHCSRSCANSHIQTGKQNDSRRERIREYCLKVGKNFLADIPIEVRKCKYCEKEFKVKKVSKKKYCSISCGSKYMASQDGFSDFMKNIAKEGKCGGHTSKKSTYYKREDGTSIYLQSSYEVTVAESLDKNDIKWTRPQCIVWIDELGEEHRYYPDFYLPKYDIYLDPKNSYLRKKDEAKIGKVQEQNGIKILVLDEVHLKWNDIKKLIPTYSSQVKKAPLQVID